MGWWMGCLCRKIGDAWAGEISGCDKGISVYGAG